MDPESASSAAEYLRAIGVSVDPLLLGVLGLGWKAIRALERRADAADDRSQEMIAHMERLDQSLARKAEAETVERLRHQLEDATSEQQTRAMAAAIVQAVEREEDRRGH